MKQCSYPAWNIRKAKKEMQDNGDKRVKKKLVRKKETSNSKCTVTIPYVKGLSEAFSQIL